MNLFLTSGQVCVIDNEDYNKLSRFKWRTNRLGYVCRTDWNGGNVKNISLHREILNFPKGVVDHVDGNKLNNLRKNLRICNKFQSNQNRNIYTNNKSGYKGVSWHKKTKQWEVCLQVNGKRIYGGYYKRLRWAAKKYNKLATIYHKQFANLNVL